MSDAFLFSRHVCGVLVCSMWRSNSHGDAYQSATCSSCHDRLVPAPSIRFREVGCHDSVMLMTIFACLVLRSQIDTFRSVS